MDNPQANRTGVALPNKARWFTRYDDGSERTTIEVDTDAKSNQVTIDPDGQWCVIHPDDLIWLAARLLDAAAMLTARQENSNGH